MNIYIYMYTHTHIYIFEYTGINTCKSINEEVPFLHRMIYIYIYIYIFICVSTYGDDLWNISCADICMTKTSEHKGTLQLRHTKVVCQRTFFCLQTTQSLDLWYFLPLLLILFGFLISWCIECLFFYLIFSMYDFKIQ